MLIIDVLVLLVVIGAVSLFVNALLNNRRGKVKALEADNKALRLQANTATKGLRAIANGAGNPVLEAQDYLDQIDHILSNELY